jgi:1-acyl-sn-glycerol-3-phosphate acyltransferase
MAVTIEEAHAFARERGTSRFAYTVVRAILVVIAKLVFRLKVTGSEYVPGEGGAIIAPNHKSMHDPFFVGLAAKRPLHYMAKDTIFAGRNARLLLKLGAYPVVRGTADPEALETSRIHLAEGRLIVLFPEGTRVRDPEALRAPRKGAGRLALEAQVPIVPCAITGTDRLFRRGFPRKVQVSFAPAIEPAQLEATPEAAADLISNQVWPQVEREFHRLRSKPGLIAAAIAALSAGGGIAYTAQRKRDRSRLARLRKKLKR